jgi:hypothetical protein
MRELIFNWLKTKVNYVYFRKGESHDIYNERFSNLLINSKVHYEDLEASPMYLIEKTTEDKKSFFKTIKVNEEMFISKIDYGIFYDPKNHPKLKFKNFNILANEYIFNLSLIVNKLSLMTDTLSKQNLGILVTCFSEAEHEIKRTNKFIDKTSSPIFKDTIFFTSKSSQDFRKLYENVIDYIATKKFDYKDFKCTYIDKLVESVQHIEEIGMFYPIVYKHDIFELKYYCAEVNILKFLRKEEKLYQIIKKFYEKYGINCDYSKTLIYLDKYFNSDELGTNHKYSYIDPFKLLDIFSDELKILDNYILDKKKINREEFWYKVLDILNDLHRHSILFQQHNLMHMIDTTRSKNRQYTIFELIDKEIKTGYFDRLNLSEHDRYIQLKIFKQILSLNNSKHYSKTITFDDFDIKYPNEQHYSYAQIIFKSFQDLLGTELEELFTIHYMIIEQLSNQYSLNKKMQNLITKMAKSIICDYDIEGIDSILSKKLNKTFFAMYEKKQKIDIDKCVNENMQEEFIRKYSKEFDLYRPQKIEDFGIFIQNGNLNIIGTNFEDKFKDFLKLAKNFDDFDEYVTYTKL